MGTLSVDFSKIVHNIGMDELKHPIFYNSPIGIRFEIGGDENVYLNDLCSEKNIVNPTYILKAFDRAKAIYTYLPRKPNILRIDAYPNECSVQKEIQTICQVGNMPLPNEQVIKPFQWDEDDETVSQFQLYWDLEKILFTSDRLLQEIIKADIGGYNGFVSNVYFADTHNSILFHMYDDRGADLVTTNKEFLRPIYEKFNSWISNYDRKKIDTIFSK